MVAGKSAPPCRRSRTEEKNGKLDSTHREGGVAGDEGMRSAACAGAGTKARTRAAQIPACGAHRPTQPRRVDEATRRAAGRGITRKEEEEISGRFEPGKESEFFMGTRASEG